LRQATYLRQIEEEAALFALEALPPEEAGRFRQRLDTGCSLCRGLLDECRNTVAILPLAARCRTFSRSSKTSDGPCGRRREGPPDYGGLIGAGRRHSMGTILDARH